MKTLIWKIRYALHMRKRAAVSILFGWESAGAWVESFGIDDFCPEDACDEELSCWDPS